MKFKKILFLILMNFFPLFLQAQQLYVSDIGVWYDNTNSYCTGSSLSGTREDFNTSYGGGNPWQGSALIEFERPQSSYPGACLKLCASLECVVQSTPTSFGIDDLTFEVFKFGQGSNPLDPSSTPPIRTFSMSNLNTVCSPPSPGQRQSLGTFCTGWDGSYNLDGIFGKRNGQYGFRARVRTNQVSPTAGNISIEQTSAYPGQNQIPIQVDVTNIHVVRSSPTLVGKITPVTAQPYNIQYRLSKAATVSITIMSTSDSGLPVVRHLVNNLPRVGEGVPDGTLTNGDFWDGKNDQGALLPPGVYQVRIEAKSRDQWGEDLAWPVTFTIGLDPLQVTDVAIKPLQVSATDVAMISYMLTEAATVYVDIFPPGTIFSDVNCSGRAGTTDCPTVGGVSPIKSFIEEKEARKVVSTYWDGRDNSGNFVCDGDYVYAITASLPSSAAPGGLVWTSKIVTGVIPIARGNPLAFLAPSSTVVGSTPPAAGLDPFYFKYTVQRPVNVTLNIRDMNYRLIKQLVSTDSVRSPGLTNVEVWDGRDERGYYVSSGTYLAELIVNDPYTCPTLRSSTHTVTFPVDMFRIVDVKTTPLLNPATGTTLASINFELTQTMWIDLKIYDPSVNIDPLQWPWNGLSPVVYSISGMRPGRYLLQEPWDGRTENGLILPDGRYPFTLVAHTTAPAGNIMYATDKVYGYIDIARGSILFTAFEVKPTIPQMYSSSEVIKLPPYDISYMLNRQSSVTIQITDLDTPPGIIANIVNGVIRDANTLYHDFWDGKCNKGNVCSDGDYVKGGAYNVRIVATDISSTLQAVTTVQLTIEAYPLRIYDVSIIPLTFDNPAVISYQVSEPMKVVTKIFKPGTKFDDYGNPYPPENISLVKRIIGVRPARTQISEYWDGTDMSLSRVPDGNYIFKIYASTDTNGISSLDGSIKPGTNLADDIIIADIPMVKTAIGDLCEEFNRNSFFMPNPYTGNNGKFKIYVPSTGKVSIKIYNLAGDKIWEYESAVTPGDNYIEQIWNKINASGRKVSSGVYVAVLKYNATEGAKDICQVRKKILVP